MNNQENARQPAFPVMPVADQFGTVHVFAGQTKQEYLAAQIFVYLFKVAHEEYSEGTMSEPKLRELLIGIKKTAFSTAEFFYTTEAVPKIVSNE